MAGKGLARSALAGIACLWLVGCGYHFAGEGPGPKPGLQKIAIPVFENKTSEAELETLFAGALRHEFMVRGSYRIVPAAEAEAVFRGRIIRLYTTELAHAAPEATIESRVYIVLDVRCIDTKTGAVLWQDNNLLEFAAYLQSTDPIVAYEGRRRAEASIARKLAERIHDRFLSNF
jgi:hypothetical protein